MKKHKNTKGGLDLPILGQPQANIVQAPKIKNFALRGVVDFKGLKPSMKVSQGSQVKIGQPLFEHKENQSVVFPSPVSGKVVDIVRGDRRVLKSVIIKSDGKDNQISGSFKITGKTSASEVKKLVLKSGHFSAFKTRPYNKVPQPHDSPSAIFITAVDTNPLAVDAGVVIEKNIEDFKAGVNAVAKLTTGKTFVCSNPSVKMPKFDKSVVEKTFSGSHPSGNVGTHIHFLFPVSNKRTVWTIGYQDVINIGHMARTGKIRFDRIISLAGPVMSSPRLVQTQMGASIKELLATDHMVDGSKLLDKFSDCKIRIISGSVLWGDSVVDGTDYISRSSTQISIVSTDIESRGLGWLIPWRDQFASVFNVQLSSFLPKRLFKMDCSLGGSYRAIIPFGHFERLTPLDILPVQLMRSIIVGDTDMAQKLGLLELDGEDVALFSYADIGKQDFIGALDDCLSKVESEG